jgi:hypothetical protein
MRESPMNVELHKTVTSRIELEEHETRQLTSLLRLAFTIIPDACEEEVFALKLYNELTDNGTAYDGDLEDLVLDRLKDRETGVDPTINTLEVDNAIVAAIRKGL